MGLAFESCYTRICVDSVRRITGEPTRNGSLKAFGEAVLHSKGTGGIASLKHRVMGATPAGFGERGEENVGLKSNQRGAALVVREGKGGAFKRGGAGGEGNADWLRHTEFAYNFGW